MSTIYKLKIRYKNMIYNNNENRANSLFVNSLMEL